MKKFLILLIAIPFLSLTTINDRDQFVGKWVGNDNQEIGFIQFDEEGYVSLGIEGQEMGGKNFEIRGEKGDMTYTINDKTDPIEVDLVVTKLKSGEQKKLLCIVKFLSVDQMKIAIDFQNLRPTGFTEENSIILTKE